MQARNDSEAWKQMVLRSKPRPAWLAPYSPDLDVVLSTRVRLMRNLAGHRFPHRAPDHELIEVMQKVCRSASEADLDLEQFRGLTNAERDYFVGCRVVSPDFPWVLLGRAFLIDHSQTISLMVNEEDHIRLQAMVGGWSCKAAGEHARSTCDALAKSLRFAESPELGYIAASPPNCGAGRRRSAMFHLIGLAHEKRLTSVLKALAVGKITVRGVFGESSRAIGAFVQVSQTNGPEEEFIGACEYLIDQEREARSSVDAVVLAARVDRAKHFAQSSRQLSLGDALRVLGWVRWSAWQQTHDGAAVRRVDEALTMLDLRAPGGEQEAAANRATHLRSVLGL